MVFARAGSAFPHIALRSSSLLIVSCGMAVLQHYYPNDMVGAAGNHLVLPFQMVVAIMTSFRLNDAFRRYQAGNRNARRARTLTARVAGSSVSRALPAAGRFERLTCAPRCWQNASWTCTATRAS